MGGMGVTLDSGALIAAERGDHRTLRHLELLRICESPPTIPAAVIVEAWRGGPRQARLSEVLGFGRIEDLDEALARRAGELLGRTGTSDAVDAIVACSAARRGDIVLTSDPDHLQRLADDLRTIKVIGI